MLSVFFFILFFNPPLMTFDAILNATADANHEKRGVQVIDLLNYSHSITVG